MRHLYGDQVDQVLTRTVASGSNMGVWAYLTDNLGSVRDLMNWSAQVQDHLDYDGFGNATESNASVGGRYGWTGRERDTDTGWQYNRARYYDAKIGRWTGEDPLGFAGGDVNLDRYVHNGPTLNIDPTGLRDPVDVKPDKEGTTEQMSEAFKAVALKRGCVPRDILLKNKRWFTNVYTPKKGPNLPKGYKEKGAVAGTYYIWKTMAGIPDKAVVGFKGCDVCVGIILFPRKGDAKTHPVIVIHIHTGGDDPNRTILKALKDAGINKLNNYVAFTGGANLKPRDPNGNAWVNYTFFYSAQQLRLLGCTEMYHFRTGSLYIDKKGTAYNGEKTVAGF